MLHPLPRVDEISTDFDADPRARYFEQARPPSRTPLHPLTHPLHLHLHIADPGRRHTPLTHPHTPLTHTLQIPGDVVLKLKSVPNAMFKRR